ncbi:MAG TPA: pilus assembly protein TadG-related protein [Vicinamibacterales bacterium]|nr:pilus assembly protein TadG-related protein [Vicinamibacterales bacterium]
MTTTARTVSRDERGMSLVFVGLGFMAFVAATMLAIDVGMLMTARSQAQNAADAGAHAGAVALAFDDYNNRSSAGPAVQNALARARANQVMRSVVSVTPADVEFLNDPTGEPNRVKVTVHRATQRGNPLPLIIAPLFGIARADIHATATAEASPADIIDRCFPFTIPDKWDERNDPPFNSETSTYDLDDSPKDRYIPVGEEGYLGYNAETDKGSLIILKTDNLSKVSPSIYNPITVPSPLDASTTGAARYRASIVAGRCATFPWGSMMVPEPGMMTGPTKQGIEDLIALDRNARWDEDCECVVGSTNPDRPRIGGIPLYDPHFYETGKQNGRNADFRVANFIGVFIEGMRGNEVMARIVPIGGRRSGSGGIPGAMFPKAIRIVE